MLGKKEQKMYRKKMSKRKSKKLFARTGSKTHKKNLATNYVMRGGIRL